MTADFSRKAGEILRSAKPIEDRLREFTGELSGWLGGGIVSVLLFDRDSEDFYVRTSTLRVTPAAPEFHFAAEGTLEELALAERRPIILSEGTRPANSRRRGTVLMFPLISSGDPYGVLVLQTVTEGEIPEERLSALADAAVLLSDAVGVSLREESAALRMTKIAAINEAGINIISTLDLSRLLKLVATSACLILEAETCVIRLLDPLTGKFGIREYYGMKSEGEQKDLFLMDKKAVTMVLKGEPSVLVRDAAQETGWRDFAGVARTLACVPLHGDGEILGTVTIFDKFPHKTFFPSSFTPEDLATFGKFLRYAEKAVTNAIAYERNERLKNLDESTSLPTLKYFQERLLNEISRAKRFERRLVLMICEIQAHVPAGPPSRASRGDWVMKRVAKAIRASLREYDIVARISEGKFGMILPEAEDGKISAIPRIKKAIAAEAEEIRRRAKGARVEVRFGHAAFPEDGDDHEKLIFKSNILKA
ncbi:MAG TPA: diguanylate cyclase [Candidatus Methylomirabilis sp.]|nr:diguanylate cyclase [Candidatus Methylomirabilis sp.]